MSEFEPIPEEIPRQSSVSRSHHKEGRDGGSSDRLSKSSDKAHGVKEKKSRSSKSKSSKSAESASTHGGHRSGSNSSSKSGSKYAKSEPLISLSSSIEMDMGLSSGTNNHGELRSIHFRYPSSSLYIL